MKKLSLIIALCTCVAFFCKRDTDTEKEGRRNLEPWLSNVSEWRQCRPKGPVAGRVVEESDCEPASTVSTRPCWEIVDPDSARRALSSQLNCTDRAIDILRRYATGDSKVTSDLAAALYVRAQREDRPEDLLEALAQANLAVTADASLPEARFNRALILETLGLTDQAIAAWTELLAVANGDWRNEGLQRRNRLRDHPSYAERWSRNEHALAAALRARDQQKVQSLIQNFPSSAQRYFEEVLCVQWADAPTPEHLEELHLFAQALSARLKDPFSLHAVEAIVRAKDSPEKTYALRDAHRAYARAGVERRTFSALTRSYDSIAALFEKGESPFTLAARIRNTEPLARERNTEPLAREAEKREYRYLAALAHWHEGHELSTSDFLGSLAAYQKALFFFRSMRDEEGLAAVHARIGGVYGVLGDRRNAWREAYYTRRHMDRLVEPKHQTVHYLEIAQAARQWKQHELAILYLNKCIEDLDELVKRSASPPPGVNTYLASALRHRAQAALQLGRADTAERDLRRLVALPKPENADSDALVWLKARDAEVHAQGRLRQGNTNGAIRAFSVAVANTEERFTTIRASLLAQRAKAYRLANNEPAAKRDLEAAVNILQREGESQLARRGESETEKSWRPYFDRFQETYRELIRLYMERRDFAGAFAYAEQARAAEPLNLVGGHATDLRELQSRLHPDTYILEYCVLENETYYWLIGRQSFRVRRSVPRKTIERWNKDFSEAVQDGRMRAAEDVLAAAYAELIAPALPHLPPRSRLVVIPDGALYGLPFAAFHHAHEYLVQKVVIEYSGSAALYLHSLVRNSEIPLSATPSVLVVGDPSFDETLPFAQDLRPLPIAAREATRIRSEYLQSDSLIGKEATVPEFLTRAPNHDVVHVAAHAVVNTQEPSLSTIFFAHSTGHRGGLKAQELMRMRRGKTRLMVLSACETGAGLPIGSEGVAPLVRPILASGVPGVVASLWKVQDSAPTEALMVSFHRHYASGSDAASALATAQREAINNKTSIKDWAAFQMIGHASSPRGPDPGGTSIGIHSSNSLQRPDRLRSQ